MVKLGNKSQKKKKIIYSKFTKFGGLISVHKQVFPFVTAGNPTNSKKIIIFLNSDIIRTYGNLFSVQSPISHFFSDSGLL
jgi:hypothetical protein